MKIMRLYNCWQYLGPFKIKLGLVPREDNEELLEDEEYISGICLLVARSNNK